MKTQIWRMLLAHTLGGLVSIGLVACNKGGELKAIQTQKFKDLTITLLSETGELKQGKNEFVVEFRSATSQQPVDVGVVALASTMSMPGMSPMSAGVELSPTGEIGRYRAKAGFEMSGAWQFALQWDGPAGRGSSTFRSNVR